jgi:hypothetical protein
MYFARDRVMTSHRLLLRMLVSIGAIGALFSACAQGTQDSASSAGAPETETGEGGGSGSSTGSASSTASVSTGNGGSTGGGIGDPCDTVSDCVEGKCTVLPNGKFCTTACPPDCPKGTYCALVQGDPLCIPDKKGLCGKCEATSDCKESSSECLTAPLGDKFCARDCTTLGECPNGFQCVDRAIYSEGSGVGGGGATSASSSGAGGAPAGMPNKFCVPSSGLSCPCDSARDGVTHGCRVHNAAGTCTGTETCNGSKSQWQGCTAATPVAEICNGKDDDCDTIVDNGDPNALCSDKGPPPANSSWTCSQGECSAGPCDPGWANYPPEAPGCTCAVDLGEPNGDCGTATSGGTILDTGGSPAVLQGTLSSASDVDFWQFSTVDAAEGGTNSYHVSINFTAPTPNDEFVMDVIRGDACMNLPSGSAAGITSYDWCVNGVSADGKTGEAPCGDMIAGTNQCADHSSKYFVRVYRKLGATGTCTQYAITVTAGGGACDFTQTCQ